MTATASNTALRHPPASPSKAVGMIDLSTLSAEHALERLVNHAVQMRAGDLFLLTNEEYLSIHVRHLGVMRQIGLVGGEHGRRIISHLKAAAGLDINERRRPADGRWIHESEDGAAVDLRISSIPTLHGEDICIRLLVRENALLGVETLGLAGSQRQTVESMIASPGGLILCTGPTGSGKTATLYALLTKLNDGKRKINTIEDPVEYNLPGLRQSQAHPAIGLGFADLLRSVMRQSPDVIMVGEIRDKETADTAVRAANSGHLVLSTLHAPIAAGAVQSMLSLGTHPHFLASALRGVIAQRLVRTLCPACRSSFPLDDAPHTFDEVRPLLGPEEGKTFYGPGACDACGFSGYDNRTGVFEVLEVGPETRELIAQSASSPVLHERAVAAGMLDFRKAALLKVAHGITSSEEVFRVIPIEHLRPA